MALHTVVEQISYRNLITLTHWQTKHADD